jgi:S1-C subfamily serine protease
MTTELKNLVFTENSFLCYCFYMNGLKFFFVTAILFILVAVNGFLIIDNKELKKEIKQLKNLIEENKPITKIATDNLSELTAVNIFKSASPSVVFITSIELRTSFFSLNVYKIPKGTGTGFVWDKEGRIVTNYHVIENAGQVEVTLYDHSVWSGEIIGVAPEKDLAVLKINAPKNLLKPLSIGESSNLSVGQQVFAIGNPFGLDQTMTSGIISALNREIESVSGRTIQGVIQTDAAINPGNSGGPLLNSKGQLIGINTAIYSPVGVNSGIGFAVPVNTITKVIPQLIVYGRLIKPGLDIAVADQRVANRLGIKGVLIVDVYKGGNAHRAGLRGTEIRYGEIVLGDIIIAIDNYSISNYNDYLNALDNFKVGDTVTVAFIRNKKRHSVKIKLKAQK